MFESLLPAVTLVALGLLVPAGVVAMLLARGRHASASVGGDRRGRIAIAAAAVAAAAGTAAWFLGAGPLAATVASLMLAVPVVVWAYLAPWWPVRAVVTWAMLVTGAVGTVGMVTSRALETSVPWTALPVAAAGAALVVFVLGRLNGPFRKLLGIRAGVRRAVRTPVLLRPALLRPALALAVFFAALAAGGLTGVAPRPGGGSAPQAGSDPEPGRSPTSGPRALDASDVRPVSADATTPSEAMAPEDRALLSERSRSGGLGSGTGFRTGTVATPTVATRTGDAGDGGASTTGGGGSAGGTRDNPGATTASAPSGGTDPDQTQSDPANQLEDAVSTVTETVGKTTETVQQSGGGGGSLEPLTSVVEETVEPVKSVVEETVQPVESVVEDPVGAVTDPIASTLP